MKISRNRPKALSGFPTIWKGKKKRCSRNGSQSPEGSKWFSHETGEERTRLRFAMSQSPEGSKWFSHSLLFGLILLGGVSVSQSPEGSKWFSHVTGAESEKAPLEDFGRNRPKALSGFPTNCGVVIQVRQLEGRNRPKALSGFPTELIVGASLRH